MCGVPSRVSQYDIRLTIYYNIHWPHYIEHCVALPPNGECMPCELDIIPHFEDKVMVGYVRFPTAWRPTYKRDALGLQTKNLESRI